MTIAYARNFIKSESFFSDFTQYLEDIFMMRECLLRDEKIKIVIDKCYHIFSDMKLYKTNTKVGLENIKKYLEKNSKCKLPWTDNEIRTAKNCVKDLIEKKL